MSNCQFGIPGNSQFCEFKVPIGITIVIWGQYIIHHMASQICKIDTALAHVWTPWLSKIVLRGHLTWKSILWPTLRKTEIAFRKTCLIAPPSFPSCG